MGVKWEKIWKGLALVGTLNLGVKGFRMLHAEWMDKVEIQDYFQGNALITGCTDKVVIEICKLLANGVTGFLVMEESYEKFQVFQKEIKEINPNAQLEWIDLNLSGLHRNFEEKYQETAKKLENFKVSLVVHGKICRNPGFLVNQSDESSEKLISENIYPVTVLNHLFVSHLERDNRKGLVITLGNSIEEGIFPGFSLFSAGMRYQTFLSEGLKFEYQDVKFALLKLDPGLAFTQEGREDFSINHSELARSFLVNLKNGYNYPSFKFRSWLFFSRLFPYMPLVFLTRLVMPWYLSAKVLKK